MHLVERTPLPDAVMRRGLSQFADALEAATWVPKKKSQKRAHNG